VGFFGKANEKPPKKREWKNLGKWAFGLEQEAFGRCKVDSPKNKVRKELNPIGIVNITTWQ